MATAHLDRCRYPDEAYVSLATNDQYAGGALVLGQSLRRTNASRKLTLLITKDVSHSARAQLHTVWDEVSIIEPMDSQDVENLALMARPELGITFTKLKIWTLTHYKKCVFLDADTLILQNVDDLFERDEFSAAPDVGWPDCFNTGVFVFVPSHETYNKLLQFAVEHGSFDGGDQGLLNMYFKDWVTKGPSHRLPFIYNMVSNVTYSYAPAFKMFGKDVKIVHFLGAIKPWHHYCDEQTGEVVQISSPHSAHDQFFLQSWWDVYREVNEATDQQGVKRKDSGSAPTWSGGDRKSAWEHGHIDYRGEDRFENIQKHLDDVISGSPVLSERGTDRSYYGEWHRDFSSSCKHQEQIHSPFSASGHPPTVEEGHVYEGERRGSGQAIPVHGDQSSFREEHNRWADEHQREIVDQPWRLDHRELSWRRGQVDYLGEDRFDNILHHLRKTIGEDLVIRENISSPEIPESDRRRLQRRAKKMLKRMDEKKEMFQKIYHNDTLSYEEKIYLVAQKLAKEMAAKMAKSMAAKMSKEMAKQRAKRLARSMVRKYIKGSSTSGKLWNT